MRTENDSPELYARPAELRLPTRGVSLNVSLAAVTDQGACVQLRPTPHPGPKPLPGESADLILVRRGRVVAASVTVHEVRDSLVFLRFATGGRGLERRRQARRAVDLPVMLRSVADASVRGAWVAGRVVDLSIGGMRVHYPVSIGAPTKVEARVALGKSDEGGADAAISPRIGSRNLSRAPSDNGTVRMTCRVVHTRRALPGEVELRLAFTSVPDVDLLLLASYLADAATDQTDAETPSDARAA